MLHQCSLPIARFLRDGTARKIFYNATQFLLQALHSAQWPGLPTQLEPDAMHHNVWNTARFSQYSIVHAEIMSHHDWQC